MTAWMTLRRLEWLLRSLGPGVADWPERDRQAALALLRRSARARSALADALALEDAPASDPVLLCRMQARLRAWVMPASPAAAGMRWGALAACALAGLWLGVSLDADPAPDLFAAVQAAVPLAVPL